VTSLSLWKEEQNPWPSRPEKKKKKA
jgi:hypothetical protein